MSTSSQSIWWSESRRQRPGIGGDTLCGGDARPGRGEVFTVGNREVARCLVSDRIVKSSDELGLFVDAALCSPWAPRVETAPGGGVDGGRHVADQDDALPNLRRTRVWNGNGGQQGPRVRMP